MTQIGTGVIIKHGLRAANTAEENEQLHIFKPALGYCPFPTLSDWIIRPKKVKLHHVLF